MSTWLLSSADPGLPVGSVVFASVSRSLFYSLFELTTLVRLFLPKPRDQAKACSCFLSFPRKSRTDPVVRVSGVVRPRLVSRFPFVRCSISEWESWSREGIHWVEMSELTIAAASAWLGIAASVYLWKRLLAVSQAGPSICDGLRKWLCGCGLRMAVATYPGEVNVGCCS